jgi:hypothetical protein
VRSPLVGHVLGVEVKLKDIAHAKLINAYVRQVVDSELDAIRKEFSSEAVEIEIKCTHKFASGFLASIGCDVYEYAGGPYPDLAYVSANIWTCGPTVRSISIKDLCTGVSNCEPRIDAIVEKHFSASRIGDFSSIIGESRDAGEDPLSVFVFAKNSMVFSFREQLPHVADDAGNIRVPLPEVATVLREGNVYRDISGAF